MSSGMTAQKEVALNETAEHWRKRYFNELTALENEMAQMRAVEELLRRFNGRFCIALRDCHPGLDPLLETLIPVFREPASEAALKQLLTELNVALKCRDKAPAPDASDDSSGVDASERLLWPNVLLDLLQRIRFDASLKPKVAALTAKLRKACGDAQAQTGAKADQLTDLLGAAADLVNRQQGELHTSLLRFQSVFQKITRQLDGVFENVAADAKAFEAARDSGLVMERQIMGEVDALGASVRETVSLEDLQQQVEQRLQTIDVHMCAFREREREQASVYHTRATDMRRRIVALETQSRALHAAMQAQKKQAYMDPLCGIPNRRAYERQAGGFFKRSERHGSPLCLAIWDIDNFKMVNDSYGHAAGDKAIRLVARKLASSVRETDFVGRFGGEEFVMLLEDTDVNTALPLLEQWRVAVAAAPFHHGEKPVALTVSCGVAQVRPGESLDRVFERADSALYAAKRSGRNLVSKAV